MKKLLFGLFLLGLFLLPTHAWAATRYWVGGNGSTNWTAITPTNWSATSGGSGDASVPGSSDDVFFDGVGGGASNSNVSASINIKSLDMTGYANTLTVNTVATITVSGSGGIFKVVTGFSMGGSSALAFTGTSGTMLITTNAVHLQNVNFNGSGGTWQIQDDSTFDGNTGITLSLGTLDLNNKLITIPNQFASAGGSARTLLMKGSTVVFSNNNGVFWNVTSSLTITAASSTIKLTNNSVTAETFTGGGLVYNNLWFSRGSSAANITIGGSNTFNNLKDDGTGAHSILFTAGTTQKFTGTPPWSVSGNSTAVRTTINSTNTATFALVNQSPSQACGEFLNVQHAVATPVDTWFAGTRSVNNQSVSTAGSGVTFSPCFKNRIQGATTIKSKTTFQ